MDDDTAKLLRTAFDAYIARRGVGGLEPSDSYLPYDFEKIDAVQWSLFGGLMVKDELGELTNNLNHWHGSLRKWAAWNSVIAPYGEEKAWEVRREFLEALAHHCLLQPSAMRDTLTFVVTNSMHQVRLASDTAYPDYLKGDPTTPGNQPKYLNRGQMETRLSDLISIFPGGPQFMEALRNLNDKAYQQQTSDYRNLTSHTIGPRLGIGITRTVVRTVVQATKLTEQPDGKVLFTPVPGKMNVQYGYGGTGPLDMEKALDENLEQYRRARRCYEEYLRMLGVGLDAMPAVQAATSVS